MYNLEILRKKIDKIDKKIVELLVERFKLTKKVGIYKKEKNMPALNKEREINIFKERKNWAKNMNLNPFLVEKIFKLIIKDVKKNHQKIKKT